MPLVVRYGVSYRGRGECRGGVKDWGSSLAVFLITQKADHINGRLLSTFN